MTNSFATFIGQEAIKAKLRDLVWAAKENERALPHILLSGPSEMGKATLANAIAGELERPIRSVDATAIEKCGDLAAILTNLKPLGVLLMQDIDSLHRVIMEVLVSATSQNHIDIVVNVGRGHADRPIRMPLPLFTLIATTSNPSRIDHSLRRWMIHYQFASYSQAELTGLVSLLAGQSAHAVDPGAASLIAEYCEGSVGNAQVLLTRIFDYCKLFNKSHVTREVAEECLIAIGFKETGNYAESWEDRLQSMTGTEFEEYVAGLFRNVGYDVEITQASGDHGIDLLLRKGNTLEVVQCKRWGALVGEPVVRDFYGAILDAGARFGHLITTSSFTKSARLFAEGKPIRLIDREVLTRMAHPQPLPEEEGRQGRK
jgi:Holliday junction resolvasome RuvABC ATP-dependent DNA helicase subunit